MPINCVFEIKINKSFVLNRNIQGVSFTSVGGCQNINENPELKLWIFFVMLEGDIFYFFHFQANNVKQNALPPDIPAHGPNDNIIFPYADLYDVQRVALHSSRFRCRCRLFLIWMEEICSCGRYRTLSLIKLEAIQEIVVR